MRPRSVDELVEFSHRLLHDIQIFFSVSRSLIRRRIGLAQPVSWDLHTAAIESFGLHSRALTDFFFTKKQGRGEDDAFAFHFFEPPQTWIDVMPPQGPWLRQVRMRATKAGGKPVDQFGAQIAHLSFRSTAPSDFARGWPVMQVASEMGSALRVFLDNVQPAVLAPHFHDAAAREIPVIARLDGGPHPMAVWTPPELHRPWP
jgi:hypothetical protein